MSELLRGEDEGKAMSLDRRIVQLWPLQRSTQIVDRLLGLVDLLGEQRPNQFVSRGEVEGWW